ncbi:WD40 repeat domain-containing protein [Cellulophaga baltica]|uniref:WD40 repeat domain-containing protein n=1 Tax=Cellulophaga baltica TaxID=76594 RepID=A0A1G7LSV5_9FLAO|nr:hypothetical protein [Cellulophaga baltica]SDF52523.1 hypothetical protein SAMN04487992_12115 [Cellulophaga baltica]
MGKRIIFLVVLQAILSSCEQKITIKEAAFTTINPLSYTDVTYTSSRDTVLVSTFNGRIAERINGQEKEKLWLNLADEIYSITYDSNSHILYASTLNSGVAVIDVKKKRVIHYLNLEGSWIPNLKLSLDGKLLVGRSSDRKNHIWDLKNHYKPIALPDSLSNYSVTEISKSGSILLKGNGSYIFWNPLKLAIEREVKVKGNLAAMDASNNMLLFNDTHFQYYNAITDSLSPKKQHQDWPYYIKEQNEIIRIPLQLGLTVGQLSEHYIFTAGIDRSIRKWHKLNGEHIEDILKHKATVSAMAISPNASQLVSVDLKGGIVFYEMPLSKK